MRRGNQALTLFVNQMFLGSRLRETAALLDAPYHTETTAGGHLTLAVSLAQTSRYV